jgi:hypothetical protein
MAAGGANWVWQNSRASNGSLLVLLAVVDECEGREFTDMSVAQIGRKARLSDRAVRTAVKALEALGELAVTPATGSISRYEPRQILPDHPGRICRTAESAPRQNLPDPSEDQQVSGTPAESAGPEISDVFVSSTGSSLVEVKDVPAKPSRRRNDGREDVDRLCAHLAKRIQGNGANRPNIGEKWRDAARLMLDVDERTEENVHKAIDWCQDHEFWRANILSMPKLREKYDQLQLQAMRGPRSSSRQPQESDYDQARRIARELDALEEM